MGYSGAIGTMLMDEMAGVCGRAEERFTGIRTDISKLETDTGGKGSINWGIHADYIVVF